MATRPDAVPPAVHVPDAVRAIARRLEDAGFETWCVGGALRDARLGLPHADIDLATAATPAEVQRLFRRTVPVGVSFGTVGVLDDAGVLHEVTTFRHDVSTDGRRAVVRFGVSIDDDLARRDFTINALAYHPLRGTWRDPHDGAGDLGRGVVRAVGEARVRMREDYLRILRGLRFAARFGFALDPETWAAMQAEVAGIQQLSAERVRDEWRKGLESAWSVRELVRLWHEVGAAAVWLPELRRARDVPDPATATPRDWVRLTALSCEAPDLVLRRLRGSSAEVARGAAMARGPLAPAGAEARWVRRWLAAVGDAADDLLALAALRAGGVAPAWAATAAEVRARGEATRRGDLAVTGEDLRAAGVAPGRRMGQLLDQLLDRVLDDPALNTRERLLALLAELA